ncbi:TetR-like C-terminal domain-containing protein [Streptomyces sp. NEAU-YJ-81]|uniref:TetR-like C-terminal domain-containing protein n=1 Tax=Streptomyces sp. NEAU-YJ-81 TaxID=2820288 RepID=UPI001ABD2A86|nr:TetR-like C-terminal domain-containing protein [Streptomyces sp. NEAU-YJ-81]MBO3680425.1 TetR/AcrR family transcriptional regulator C-terminal ligand-binding domain-containing protein [Streptomyces sp. NEAU-YJ-81]
MTAPQRPARRGRGRRPIAQVRAEVLEAAAAVLMREGVGGFTIEKVIVHSGVSSATVYKHWPSRGALALDGYLHAVGDEIALRDTGDIRADLVRGITAFVRMVGVEPAGPVFAQLIGAAQTDSELASQFDQHYFGPRRRQAFALLEAAKERGQIRSDADLGVIVDIIWGACYIRLLLPHLTGTLTVDFARDVVHQALNGVTLVEKSG